MEDWKQIEDTQFYISNMGRIKNIETGNILKTSPNRKGYLTVHVTVNRVKRCLRPHRLVAEYFIPNPENKEQVNHINCNKEDNRVENLEWCTNLENMRHAIAHGRYSNGGYDGLLKHNELRKKRIIATSIDGKQTMNFDSIREAERYFNSRHITDVLKGKRSKTKGFFFSYVKEGG